MIIELGNHRALDGRTNPETGEVTHDPLDGLRVTTVLLQSDTPLAEVLTTITAARGVWVNHSAEPPAWVASDDDLTEAVLAQHFGCARGRPADMEARYHTAAGPPGIGPDGPVLTSAKKGR